MRDVWVVDAQELERALEIVRGICGPKDPQVQEELYDQENFKEGEYFQVALYQIPSDTHAVYVLEVGTGFPESSVSLRI